MKAPNAKLVIETLGLTPLGFEGGYFRETYRCRQRQDGRDLGTGIFYLLDEESRSLMHRLKSDELYHFYLGDPVELFCIYPDGESEVVRLGSDILGQERVQHLVPAGSWQGSRLAPGGRMALMGTTMAPGFELRDFELGRRGPLSTQFPLFAERICALTPEVIETERLELTAGTRDLLWAELRGLEPLVKGLAACRAEGGDSWMKRQIPSPEYVLERLESGSAEQGWWTWYIVRTEDRVLIGTASYSGRPGEGPVELRLALAPAVDGEYGAEALERLAERALADDRVRAVEVVGPLDTREAVEGLLARGFASVGPGGHRYARARSAGSVGD